jgi:hypothetical protein
MPAAGTRIGSSPAGNGQGGHGAGLKRAEALFPNQPPDKRRVFRCGMAAAAAGYKHPAPCLKTTFPLSS